MVDDGYDGGGDADGDDDAKLVIGDRMVAIMIVLGEWRSVVTGDW